MFFCRIFGVKCDRCGVVLSPHDLVSIVIIVVILAIIIVVIITMTIAGDAHNGLYLSPWLLSMRYVRATIAGIISIAIIITIRSISISIAIIINNNVIIVIAFLLTMMRCGSLWSSGPNFGFNRLWWFSFSQSFQAYNAGIQYDIQCSRYKHTTM